MNRCTTIIIGFTINVACLCFSVQALARQALADQELADQAPASQLPISQEPTNQFLDKLQQNADQQAYDIDSKALSRLYQQTSGSLWLEQDKLTAAAFNALKFIAGSVNHGLEPNDYHYDLLTQLKPTANKSDPGFSNSGLSNTGLSNTELFELLLSDGILKLMHDISSGRLDPAVVDPKWSIPVETFDAVSFLRDALAENRLRSRLQSLLPLSDEYRRLSSSIKRYQDYVDRGGWQIIPPTPMLKPGDSHENIPVIRERLNIEGYKTTVEATLLRDTYDDNLVRAIKRYQYHHGIVVDGILGPETLNNLNISARERLRQIKLTLERLRWLPHNLGKKYIMVNLANYRLTAVEDEKVILDMRVIIGKTERPTPSFSSEITDIVHNPHWYVPGKLARQDLLPKQQHNPNFFTRANIRVFGNVDGKKVEIDPETIDWRALSAESFPYTLVQDPGKHNALGTLKFVMPNPWAIYLHDTPSKSLFNHTARNFSSGCIRVERPLALAEFSLAGNLTGNALEPLFDTDKQIATKITLQQPLPVYLVYTTVWLDGDKLMFSPDRYQRDRIMAQYL